MMTDGDTKLDLSGNPLPCLRMLKI